MKRLLAIFISSALTACVPPLGPEHSVPETPLPDRWNGGAASGPRLSAQWWRLFGDDELNRLETLALASNQELVVAMGRIDEARADLRNARADLLPGTHISGSAERSQNSTNSAQSPGFSPDEVDQYRVNHDFSYEIDLWGKVRRSVESKQATLAATAYARDAVMLRLTGEVAEQYFNLRTLDAELALLQDSIDLRRSSLEIARTRFQGGITTQSDVTRALSALASAEAEAAETARRRSLSENILAQLCGKPAGSFHLSNRAGFATCIPTVPLGKPASLLRQRPDIAESERVLAARSADIGVAMGERFPSLEIKANLRLDSLSLGDLLSADSRAFGIGPEFSTPVLTGGAAEAHVRKAQARHAQATADYRVVVLAAVKEVEDALTNQRGYQKQAEKLRSNIEAAALTTKLSLERYTRGLVNFSEVVDSQREEVLARRSLVQTHANRLISSVHLMKSLGGGWRDHA